VRIPAKFLLAISFLAIAPLSPTLAATTKLSPQGTSVESTSPKQIYELLQAVRVDGANVYPVRDLTLRRDGVTFTFVDGQFAFLQPVEGRITGAVFSGRGHVFAVPPDPEERASIAHFLRVPLIDTEFWQAYLRFDEGTAKELHDGLTAQKAVASSNSDLANEWNPVIAKLNPNSSPRVLEGILASAPAPYVYAAVNSTSFGTFDVVLDERRSEDVLFGQPRHVNDTDFFDVWTSYTAENASPYTRDFAASDYGTDTTVGEDLTLTGTTVLHLKCLTGGERVLEFELSRFLQVQTVADGNGHSLDFFQNADMRRQEIARRGNDLLFVALPQAAVVGQQLELRISYHGSVIEDDGNGVYFVGARGSWYPHLSGSDEFSSFDLKFRWPKRLTLVATGKEIESGTDGNEKTGHWRSTQPVSVVGFNLGEYAVEPIHGDPLIQLFANQQLEQGIASQLRQFNANGASGFPDGFHSLPNPAAVLKQLGTKLLDSVHYYEELNGAFPFSELDVSQIPGSFGQGWPGLLYLTTFVFLPPEAQQQAGLNERAQEQVQELVPFHEVAHQWWGNVEVPASYRDVWIEEGMADYQSLMYDEKRNPSKHALQEWLSRYRDSLLAKEPDTGKTVEQSGPLDFGYRVDSSKTPGAYRIIIYEKGAWVMNMLRMMLRDTAKKNPDARFEELLKNTLSDYRFRTLSTAQLEGEVQRLMTPSMDLENSRSVDWFFDEWVRQTGIPEYSLNFSASPRGSRFLIEGSLEQRDVPGVFTERVPIYAVASNEKKFFLGSVITTGTTTRFRFTSRFRPLRLLIDPDHTILCVAK
jgi:hypothetical protein